MNGAHRELIAAVDIGTSKVAVAAATVGDDGRLRIVAANTCPCEGLRKGLVVDIEATTNAVRKAADETAMLLGDDAAIDVVHVGVTGDHLESYNVEGRAVVKDDEITVYDVERAREAAEAMARITGERMILHTVCRNFEVDKQTGVKDPVGMSGSHLQANVHLVTASRHLVDNVAKCVRRSGLTVGELVLQPLASGHAVLTEDELKLGVCLVDIGAGTTDIAVYHDNAILHSAVIPVAGDHITNDIAVTFRTPTAAAEEVKVRYLSLIHI